MKKTKGVVVVRITRHAPQPAQIEALRRLYGDDVQIVTVQETMPTDPRDFVTRFDEIAAGAGADIVEAVLPIQLLAAALQRSEFVRRGGRVIRAVMNRTVLPNGEVRFDFDHYEEVVKVEIVTIPLKTGGE
ncbi:MAG TPA: hypothetical protein EYH30_10750 [Anaerolineales bacterium]|nr:hypothetical protein [Anaerolineales bacterium]